MPAGLANRVAILARCLVSPMPTEHASPVVSATVRRTVVASSSGSSTSAPTNASSHPHTSTTTGNAFNAAITSADADSYAGWSAGRNRSEEHTSELQSLAYLVCRLLLEKKKQHIIDICVLQDNREDTCDDISPITD